MNICEQRFMSKADSFSVTERDLQPVLQRMNDWFAELLQTLDANCLKSHDLQPGSALARQARAIVADVKASRCRWAKQWTELHPAQSLAQSFEDKVMLLVFGKFNAGKSSLCNFLAERFRQQGHSVLYFHLQDGQIVQTAEHFHEGITETTARLQGVCLGDGLVLLDTPGLHSVTDKNNTLTKRFLDSAEAVLWLTSSTSPGQVQELDELAFELRRSKPLLPVITRSDCLEEDEIDGEIVTCLRNKTEFNRALQETDVQKRAEQKLLLMGINTALLQTPVSVSVHMARAQGQTSAAMTEAGFERLYSLLLQMSGPALAYRQRKPAETLLHHLQENILGSLQTETLSALISFRQTLNTENEALAQKQAHIVQAAWRSVIPELEDLLESCGETDNVQMVCSTVTELMEISFRQQVTAQLGDYAQLPVALIPIMLSEITCSGTVAAPASLTVANREESMGQCQFPLEAIGYERLYATLEQAVRFRLIDMAADTVKACAKILLDLDESAQYLQNALQVSALHLSAIEKVLRA